MASRWARPSGDAVAYQTSSGAWVVSDAGGWLPGYYDTRETALAAAAVAATAFGALSELNDVYAMSGLDRPVTRADLVALLGGALASGSAVIDPPHDAADARE